MKAQALPLAGGCATRHTYNIQRIQAIQFGLAEDASGRDWTCCRMCTFETINLQNTQYHFVSYTCPKPAAVIYETTGNAFKASVRLAAAHHQALVQMTCRSALAFFIDAVPRNVMTILVAFQVRRQRVSVCSSVKSLLCVSPYKLMALGKVRVVLSG